MPIRPKHPCNHPGCPKLTNERYCDDHRKAARKAEDARRGTAAERGYDRHWARIRAAHLRRHPLCEMCKTEGRLVAAEMVHHIVPIVDGGGNEESNLRSLCHDHHRRLHGWGGNKYGKGQGRGD